ncbi:hypothetical protein D3871_08350 [Noviherbaspirillum saxi]|uniref:Uncharacterized protein n=1 Tax=Noviherbaspirillum saxi TaxID=2320863 RepID=A0A3A3FVB7_9BURK|nr:hypothetical protein D3871_08350 [Noviherbaspirillum saxi]
MSVCNECASLAGANTATSPHANLLLHSEAAINFGATATGRIEYYICNRCGTAWERERAKSEPQAVWRHSTRTLR